ncbi:MAG: ABC transporter ATP-binding protein/permease [Actinomycetota bacterium]|nr:ABC transporter ATP-binding protein/permease [Actinomycetota bacterium]
MAVPGGHQAYGTVRSLSKDRSVTRHRLAPGTLGRIAGFARPYRGRLTIFISLILLEAGLGAMTPLVYRQIIDVGIADERTRLVVGLAFVLVGLAVAGAAISLTQRWFSARIGEGLIFDLRTAVFDHVQRQPVAFFTRTQTGSLVSRLNSDVIGAQQAFTSTLSNVIGSAATLTATLGAMFFLSWQITAMALVLLPLFLLPARRLAPKLSAITRERYQVDAAMGQTMTERFNVSGALLVKLFGRPEEESETFARRAGRVRDIGVTTSMFSTVVMVSLALVAALATALVYGVGGVFVVEGTLAIGTLVALTAYLNRLYGPITALSSAQVDIMTTLVSFERVFEVLDLQPAIAEAPDAVELPTGPTAVEFDTVSFRYPSASEVSLASLESIDSDRLSSEPGAMLLHDLSFRIDPGQMVALVGPSGAGKTTIAGLVSRLYDATGGSVRLAETDVRTATIQSVRERVGVVSQDAHLFHDTLRANLLYARPDATEDELVEALRAAQVWDLVAALPDGLDTLVGDRGHRLSGGEKQRLAIARLLLKDPAVVVLDEATAHLDSESEAAVQRALSAALEGRTSLVIAHRLATVRDADQILVVEHGRIVQRGTHEQLIAEGGLYADLVRTQLLDSAGRDDDVVGAVFT